MITVSFLDEVNDTFSYLQKKAIQGMSIVPLALITNVSASNSYASLIKDLVEFYANDLPSLEHEMHLWHTNIQITFLPRHQKLCYMQMMFPSLNFLISHHMHPSSHVM